MRYVSESEARAERLSYTVERPMLPLETPTEEPLPVLIDRLYSAVNDRGAALRSHLKRLKAS